VNTCAHLQIVELLATEGRDLVQMSELCLRSSELAPTTRLESAVTTCFGLHPRRDSLCLVERVLMIELSYESLRRQAIGLSSAQLRIAKLGPQADQNGSLCFLFDVRTHVELNERRSGVCGLPRSFERREIKLRILEDDHHGVGIDRGSGPYGNPSNASR